MTNFEMKKKAVEIIKRYLDMTVKVKDIVLLEGNEDGSYIFFSIGKSPVSYAYSLFNSFCVYPNFNEMNGMEMEWIAE